MNGKLMNFYKYSKHRVERFVSSYEGFLFLSVRMKVSPEPIERIPNQMRGNL